MFVTPGGGYGPRFGTVAGGGLGPGYGGEPPIILVGDVELLAGANIADAPAEIFSTVLADELVSSATAPGPVTVSAFARSSSAVANSGRASLATSNLTVDLASDPGISDAE